MIFEREDWSLFRTIEGLQQRAGVPKNLLPRLVLKEIADNGLDNGAVVRLDSLPKKGGYIVEDDGRGIDGAPEDIARLFSINRPMVSTKLLRLPTRGALGNGLRVVAGAILVSGGSLVVTSRNRRIVLCPERDGTTTIISVDAVEFPVGTRIEAHFGPTLPCDQNTLYWAKVACRLAQFGTPYLGRSSPWWYDAAQFHELLFASASRPVRELIAHLDGCTGGTAGEIVAEAKLERAVCRDVTLAQVNDLLEAARDNVRQVNPKRLGAVGPQAFPSSAYSISYGIVRFGPALLPQAEIPFVVEAWAEEKQDGETHLTACVNRTPATGQLHAAREKRDIDAFGCGLSHTIAKAPSGVEFNIWINITTPYMPITSDGKAPDLMPFLNEIRIAAEKAVKKAHQPNSRSSTASQKDVVLDNLDEVIASVSGGYRFNERQLFYALRPVVMDQTGKELKIGNFAAIITDFEAEHGEIPLMYREPRGSIYHPHRGETITLGTLMVEDYERPAWTFNKVVYVEKEGFSEALKEARWAERHDCMLMSSKGFTTRAARDLVDKLAEHDEPVTIFCVHDADAAGTMIYQTFQEATKARGARKINVVNLGLEPWEAADLEVETVEAGERRKAVADYILERDDGAWEVWLQTHRVELNAMTTPQFITWLDGKMAPYDKLVPPGDVIEAELAARIEAKVRAAVTDRILREAGLENQVADAIAAIERPGPAVLTQGIRNLFQQEPDRAWRDHIETVALALAPPPGDYRTSEAPL
jgi:hypothetical protein